MVTDLHHIKSNSAFLSLFSPFSFSLLSLRSTVVSDFSLHFYLPLFRISLFQPYSSTSFFTSRLFDIQRAMKSFFLHVFPAPHPVLPRSLSTVSSSPEYVSPIVFPPRVFIFLFYFEPSRLSSCSSFTRWNLIRQLFHISFHHHFLLSIHTHPNRSYPPRFICELDSCELRYHLESINYKTSVAHFIFFYFQFSFLF